MFKGCWFRKSSSVPLSQTGEGEDEKDAKLDENDFFKIYGTDFLQRLSVVSKKSNEWRNIWVWKAAKKGILSCQAAGRSM